MNRAQIKKDAEMMGVSFGFALNCRLRYLHETATDIRSYIAEMKTDLANRELNGETQAFLRVVIETYRKKLASTEKEIRRLQKEPDKKAGSITDEMIDTARDYPIERLVELNRNGRCCAFCHESDSDSMSKHPTLNLLVCFVCSKKFNPIDVLIERDGMSFSDAVKQLS